MSAGDMDGTLIRDFLLESNELVEQLDADLVGLEHDPDPRERLDAIFRALHTIKGAASFLNMSGVTSISHAAEDVLSSLREGKAPITESVIDALLASVDVLRSQLVEVAAGVPPSRGPEPLIETLRAIAARGSDQAGASDRSAASADGDADHEVPFGGSAVKAEFSSERVDVLPFMVTDLEESAAALREVVERMSDPKRRVELASRMSDIAESMHATADYFDLVLLKRLIALVALAAEALPSVDADRLGPLRSRLDAVRQLIDASAWSLSDGFIASWDISTLEERTRGILESEQTDANWRIPGDGSASAALVHDGVVSGDADATGFRPGLPPAWGEQAPESPTEAEGATADGVSRDDGIERTVRVKVSRLEHMLRLVGEMVLTKHQMHDLMGQLQEQNLTRESVESALKIASDLDRLTLELQVSVMRARMQPLDKLFGRYPRIIRDLAKKTGKKVDLQIVGGDTEVDRFVLELLGDPLAHMLRNSVGHGIESPEERRAAGKNETGRIVLAAEHHGTHVRVAMDDDGRGMSRQVIARKAIEKGIATAEQIAKMSDEKVFEFIFAAGFSTAAEVSYLSGRGVGMDVVRANVSRLGGSVHVRSRTGEGTGIDIVIPVRVAIAPVMLVEVGERGYAIPLESVVEVVRYDPRTTHRRAGKEFMRLRDAVLPLMDMRTRLGEPAGTENEGFSVVIAVGQERMGLIVDRLIGRQEVVIKPLDDEPASGGVFSGTAIRESGDTSLILDVVKLVRSIDSGHNAAA